MGSPEKQTPQPCAKMVDAENDNLQGVARSVIYSGLPQEEHHYNGKYVHSHFYLVQSQTRFERVRSLRLSQTLTHYECVALSRKASEG